MLEVNYKRFSRNLEKYFKLISQNNETVILNEGERSVVFVSLEEYNSWKETDYLFASETNRERLLKSMTDLEKGKQISKSLMEE